MKTYNHLLEEFQDNEKIFKKQCSKCKQILPQSPYYFKRNRERKDGLVSMCKKCTGNPVYGFANNKINVVLKKQHKRMCPICRNVYDITIFKPVGKYRLADYCDNCEQVYKDKKRIYDEKYLIENKERKKAYYKEWKKNGGNAIRKASESKRQENISQAKNTLTGSEWEECLQYFNNRCAYCGEDTKLAREHVIPISKNGGTIKNNIVCSCIRCNSKKHNKDFKAWYEKYEYYTGTRFEKILKWIT